MAQEGAEPYEGEDRKDRIEDDHCGLNPVTAKISQLALHGFVKLVDEPGQGVFGTAARAAQCYRPSCALQYQRMVAFFTGGFFFRHSMGSLGWR
ncbi:hypothetical protein JCM12296A_11020 [Desulfosarcina cetonica]